MSSPSPPNLRLANAALAFRGYNVVNLGRSGELLASSVYGPTVTRWLERAARVYTDATGKDCDLVGRVRLGAEADLDHYGEAIALICALEMAQLDIAKTFHGLDFSQARFSFGYSLGEITALVAGGVIQFEDALRIPLALADDCVELAHDVTLLIVFSRGPALPLDEVRQLCATITQQGNGVVGISSYLSPNSVLLMAQGEAARLLTKALRKDLSIKVRVRKNDFRWPPLHTPIVWQKHITDRAAALMQTMNMTPVAPIPKILSMVTGKFSYTPFNTRELIRDWVDHPQRVWDVVFECLQIGIETIVHIGPAPNILPATFRRLADNVQVQTEGSLRMRALSVVVRRPWLGALLPDRTALLRAPLVRQVILEDWLLEHESTAHNAQNAPS